MFTFLVKPTNNCNLRCRYCFINNNNKVIQRPMTIDDAYIVFQKIYDFVSGQGQNKCHILWHGGEPLLWGVDNFRRIFEYLAKFTDFEFEYSLQSNITLLTSEHLGLFKDYNCRLSTSIDGLKEHHNANRLLRNNDGSFDLVKEKLELAKSMGVHIGAVVVVSKTNINSLINIYEFFKSLGCGFRLNPLALIGEAKQIDNIGVTPEEYTQQLIKLFDYWIKDENAVGITNFIEIASNIQTGVTYQCSLSPNCQGSLTTIEPNGDVTPCDRFTGNEDFVYGNILTDDLEPIMRKKLEDFHRRAVLLYDTECKDCNLWNICRGGCPSDAYTVYGNINHKSLECIVYKTLVEHITRNNLVFSF